MLNVTQELRPWKTGNLLVGKSHVTAETSAKPLNHWPLPHPSSRPLYLVPRYVIIHFLVICLSLLFLGLAYASSSLLRAMGSPSLEVHFPNTVTSCWSLRDFLIWSSMNCSYRIRFRFFYLVFSNGILFSWGIMAKSKVHLKNSDLCRHRNQHLHWEHFYHTVVSPLLHPPTPCSFPGNPSNQMKRLPSKAVASDFPFKLHLGPFVLPLLQLKHEAAQFWPRLSLNFSSPLVTSNQLKTEPSAHGALFRGLFVLIPHSRLGNLRPRSVKNAVLPFFPPLRGVAPPCISASCTCSWQPSSCMTSPTSLS